MHALVFSNRLYYQQDHPDPVVRPGEALIRVNYAGICNTDLEITRGYMDFKGIPGHEFAGVVESSSEKRLIGRRVTGEINIFCGECHYCSNRLQNHCPSRSVLGITNREGVFAEYVALPVRNLHAIPDSISDVEAVFIEPLAAAYEILDQVDIAPSDSVCILGDGKLGILVGQVISNTKCNLIVAGNHRKKLSILEDMGINTSLSGQFNEKGFDIVVDCTGSPSGIETALNIVRPRGRVILKTTITDRRDVDLNSVVVNEITIIGSRCGHFPTAIQAIKSKAVDLNPLVSGIFKLDEWAKAFEFAKKKTSLKVVFKMN
jgi:threonine dehydrogenase-like Zn-dependent dehydrogenase